MARVLSSGPVRTFVNTFNAVAMSLAASPRFGRLVGHYITSITYTGRKSGRSVTLPVGYQRRGDTVTIRVMMADQKSWWRNFLGEGGPLTIHLDGTDRPAHAVAERSQKGEVSVVLQLAP